MNGRGKKATWHLGCELSKYLALLLFFPETSLNNVHTIYSLKNIKCFMLHCEGSELEGVIRSYFSL